MPRRKITVVWCWPCHVCGTTEESDNQRLPPEGWIVDASPGGLIRCGDCSAARAEGEGEPTEGEGENHPTEAGS